MHYPGWLVFALFNKDGKPYQAIAASLPELKALVEKRLKNDPYLIRASKTGDSQFYALPLEDLMLIPHRSVDLSFMSKDPDKVLSGHLVNDKGNKSER